MIHFYVFRGTTRPRPAKPKYPAVFLFDDNWDDFGFKTLFVATLQVDAEADEVDLGEVKILVTSKTGAIYGTALEDHFTALPPNYCSLGQSVRYYRHLRDNLTTKLRREYLRALQDIVARPRRRVEFQAAPGFEISLLRNGSARDALRRGGYYIGMPTEELQPPSFKFEATLPGATDPHELDVDFTPHASLPHRINLLIGRNGTGKTQLLAHLAQALSGVDDQNEDVVEERGDFKIIGTKPDFARIIAISYSAFDQFPIPKRIPRRGRKSLFDYKYCGLRNASGKIDVGELKTMLDAAMTAIEEEERLDIFRRHAVSLLGSPTGDDFANDKEYRDKLFSRLSAGQRFIIAVAADVVGFIEERSILLFDEPETHLHPGLLSTLVAILEEILHEFQSFSVVATHSPILLQQVPHRYVRILKRRGGRTTIRLPTLETFGEDLGELTRRVLDLAEPEQDFHAVLDRLVEAGRTAEEIEDMFERGLPLPAQIYLESLTAEEE